MRATCRSGVLPADWIVGYRCHYLIPEHSLDRRSVTGERNERDFGSGRSFEHLKHQLRDASDPNSTERQSTGARVRGVDEIGK